jgi:molybdopterin-guanine dinucleotide biosynthesis protein MobB
MQIAAIVGHSGCGKTHLIVRLLAHLTARSLKVATAKHTHHHAFYVDQPGKDSWRHRDAGAVETLLVSEQQFAHFGPLSPQVQVSDLLARLQPCDLVLLEGFKNLVAVPKIEVYRGFLGEPPLCLDDPSIRAIALPGSEHAENGLDVPQLDLDDTAAIAQYLLQLPPTRFGTSSRRSGPPARLAHIRSR